MQTIEVKQVTLGYFGYQSQTLLETAQTFVSL